MFDMFNSWRSFWHHTNTPGEKMPLTEKEPSERVPYPFHLRKVVFENNIEIAYIDEGEQQSNVLLFLHGMGSGIPVWEKNIRVLRKNFRCIALDLPGHGFSSRGNFPGTMNFYADVVLSFIQKLELASITLVGHSMGGQIAIIAGIKNPLLIERLVLVSPAGIEPYTALEKQTLINTMAGIVASGNAFTQNRMNYMIGFCNNQEEAGELAKKMAFFKDDAAEFGRLMLRSVEGMLLEGVNHILNKITQPCLMLVGKEDRVSPFQFLRGKNYAEIVALESAKISRCKLVIFSPCGHFVQYQRPKSFNRELLAFLMPEVVV